MILCIKNGVEHISNVSHFVKQSGENEFIIVDDFSDIKTKDSLGRIDPSIKLIHAEKDIPGKKNALTTGIKHAKHENLILSDIDCVPSSPKWAQIMSSKLQKSCEIVIGYGAYRKSKGFLNKFVRFETIMTAIQMMSYAKAGIRYMGVGRNLAYTKSLFDRIGGLRSHQHIASGDDDLFIKEAAHSKNTDISLDKESFTLSEPVSSWKSFFNQKTRHITTSTNYKMIHKILLALYAAAYIGFYVCAACILTSGHFVYALEGYLLFIFVSMIIFGLLSVKFEERDLLTWYPVLDFVFFIYLVILAPFLFFRKKTW